MSELGGAVFGIVGALAAFPRRIAAREVERQGGHLRRGVGRGTTHVVFGHRLLAGDDAATEAKVAGAAGLRLLGETGFLRLLGLAAPADDPAMSQQALLEQSGLQAPDLHLLALFDAFEHEAEPWSFRDLILARKYAGLIAGGASWAAVARSVHRVGPVASLTAKALQLEGGAICLRAGEGVSELDGQLRLDLDAALDDDLDDLFAEAEAAEAAGCPAEAAELYRRYLAVDPADASAAFNRANCLRSAGRPADAAEGYVRALKLDPAFVEAWFNLAGLLVERGHPAAARRHLQRAVALDGDYADAVFNLATLEFDAGNLTEARRRWERYLELDRESDWARTAVRGIRFVELSAANGSVA